MGLWSPNLRAFHNKMLTGRGLMISWVLKLVYIFYLLLLDCLLILSSGRLARINERNSTPRKRHMNDKLIIYLYKPLRRKSSSSAVKYSPRPLTTLTRLVWLAEISGEAFGPITNTSSAQEMYLIRPAWCLRHSLSQSRFELGVPYFPCLKSRKLDRRLGQEDLVTCSPLPTPIPPLPVAHDIVGGVHLQMSAQYPTS